MTAELSLFTDEPGAQHEPLRPTLGACTTLATCPRGYCDPGTCTCKPCRCTTCQARRRRARSEAGPDV